MKKWIEISETILLINDYEGYVLMLLIISIGDNYYVTIIEIINDNQYSITIQRDDDGEYWRKLTWYDIKQCIGSIYGVMSSNDLSIMTLIFVVMLYGVCIS